MIYELMLMNEQVGLVSELLLATLNTNVPNTQTPYPIPSN
jgi:hypothetical protein